MYIINHGVNVEKSCNYSSMIAKQLPGLPLSQYVAILVHVCLQNWLNRILVTRTSSSFCCGASGHKISPTAAILGQRNIVRLQRSIRISQEVLNIFQIQCAWPSWLTLPMQWKIQCVFFHRFIIMETKHMTQKLHLLSPDDSGNQSKGIVLVMLQMASFLLIQSFKPKF